MKLINLVTPLMLGTACRAFVPLARAAKPEGSKRHMIANILDLLGGPDKSQLIDPEKALPGRSTKMPNIDNYRHYVLGNKLEEVPEGHEVAVFANGVSGDIRYMRTPLFVEFIGI